MTSNLKLLYYKVEIKGKSKEFLDENILKGKSTGFIYLINYINYESHQNLKYIDENDN